MGEDICYTPSGILLKDFYGPDDIKHIDYERDIGDPGIYPFVRGLYPKGYSKKLPTFRLFTGEQLPEDTNRRWHQQIKEGQPGLSTAFDMPVLLGRDSDSPWSIGYVGKDGVSINSIHDFRLLFDNIPLSGPEKKTVSFTVNASAPIIFAMFIALAQERGIPLEELGGTIQNDPLKEFISQKEYRFPIWFSIKFAVDIIEYVVRKGMKFHPISISGYHIREAGADAIQELAFVFADAKVYVEECLKRGLRIEEFGPLLSFFWDFARYWPEEISKLRAARGLWAKIMHEAYHADSRSKACWCRFHTQTAGYTLTWQQPMNNIVRVSYQALGAMLGGTQSLHTNSWDEQWAIPSDEAISLALKTQQVLGYETGIADVADPFGGSYLIEYLTSELIHRAEALIKKIDEMGGMIRAIERGFPQQAIALSAKEEQVRIDSGKDVWVGVNCFQEAKVDYDAIRQKLIKINEAKIRQTQIERLKRVRQQRDIEAWRNSLQKLKKSVQRLENTIDPIIDAARAEATVEEIMNTIAEVVGEYIAPGD